MISVTDFAVSPEPGISLNLETIGGHLSDPDALLWVSVVDPSPEDLELLGRTFSIHYLAMEAVVRENARPEINFYDTFIYMNFYGHAGEASTSERQLQMVSLLVGKNYLVTVHQGPLPLLDEVQKNWSQSTSAAGQRSVGLMLYSVLDPMVDSYFTIVDSFAETIDTLESEIFQQNGRENMQRLFAIKREAMDFRRLVAPERDLLGTLLRWETPLIDRQAEIYLQDVYDHLLRVLDSLDSYRDLLGSVIDAHLSATSNRLNQTMKRLTASSIILMGMTLVASIYGMNFDHIPELSWSWGYWWALGLMTLIGAALIVVFRKIDWL